MFEERGIECFIVAIGDAKDLMLDISEGETVV